jgi:hypothetical protein
MREHARGFDQLPGERLGFVVATRLRERFEGLRVVRRCGGRGCGVSRRADDEAVLPRGFAYALRLLVLAAHGQHLHVADPEVAPFRRSRNRGLQKAEPPCDIAFLQGEDTEVVVGVRMVGFGQQDGTVELLRLVETVCAVVSDGLLQLGFDGHEFPSACVAAAWRVRTHSPARSLAAWPGGELVKQRGDWPPFRRWQG